LVKKLRISVLHSNQIAGRAPQQKIITVFDLFQMLRIIKLAGRKEKSMLLYASAFLVPERGLVDLMGAHA
jgi:hypothetical protein